MQKIIILLFKDNLLHGRYLFSLGRWGFLFVLRNVQLTQLTQQSNTFLLQVLMAAEYHQE